MGCMFSAVLHADKLTVIMCFKHNRASIKLKKGVRIFIYTPLLMCFEPGYKDR